MDELPIPIEALDDCGAILGRRGAGKSGTRTLLLEHELDRGRRCCLIDPKGDSWGIRLNPDGSRSRFQDVPIFGGVHGDLALDDTMGAILGRLVATHDLSCIVDLSAFSVAGMRRFMRDFAAALFADNRAALTLFVDEADQLAPQRLPAEMAMLLHHMESLIRQGRQRGIFMWMLTQRPQILNKNLLSQAETLVAMKMTTPHDRKAIRDWMEAHDPDKAREVMATLAELAVGEAWVWAPAADFLERVQFPLFSTFDSMRTPRHGELVAHVSLEPIDMTAIAAALAAVDEEPGAANYPDDTIPADPKAALQKGGEVGRMLKERDDRIAELEEHLAIVERNASYWHRCCAALIGRLRDARDAIGDPNDYQPVPDESQAKVGADALPAEKGKDEPSSRPAAGRSAAAAAERMAVPSCAAPNRAAPEGLPAQAQKMADMLDRIAPARVTWASLAAMVKLKPRGGHFNAGRKALRDSGRIVEEGDAVRSAAPPREGMTRDDARQLWKEALKHPAPSMIDVLDIRPMTRAELGAFLGIADHGGHFNGGVAQLVRNGVAIDVAGRLELANPLPGEKP